MFGDAIVKVAEGTNDGDPAGVHIYRLDLAAAAISTEFQRADGDDRAEKPQRPEFRVAPCPE